MKVLRKTAFPIPKRITDSDFDEICGTFKVPLSQRSEVKNRLDELVNVFRERMTDERRQPKRTSDGKRLKDALSLVGRAAAQIEKLGPAGGLAIRAISESVAPMLSAKWLNEVFYGDDFAPQRSMLPLNTGLRSPEHTPVRGEEYFIEERSLEERLEFARRRPEETTRAVLTKIAKALAVALRSFALQPGSKGGRGPLTFRKSLVMNLAEIWTRLGKRPAGSKNSAFTEFCEAVAESIGWPTEGMASAVPKALKDWRNLNQKHGR